MIACQTRNPEIKHEQIAIHVQAVRVYEQTLMMGSWPLIATAKEACLMVTEQSLALVPLGTLTVM